MSREVVFDRATGALSSSEPRLLRRARLMQVAHRGLAPFGYLGVSRILGLITRSISAGAAETVVREGEFRFRFPADDYYWNRLLDSRWSYEPEIDAFLARLRETAFVFVDLGANFGYWSARVAAGLYGPRRAVAVEASTACFCILERNLSGAGDRARAFRYAVADRSGDEVSLFGTRHLGYSIDPDWSGASATIADVVSTITLDDLLRQAEIGEENALVVKLDVEGVEKKVLEGARSTIARRSVFLVEDAVGRGGVSDAVRYAHEELGMQLYSMTESGIRSLDGLSGVLRLKQDQKRLQQSGLNLIATASPWWHQILDGFATPAGTART